MSTIASQPRRFSFQFAAVPAFILADLEAKRLKRGDVATLASLLRVARGGVIERRTDEDLAALCGVSESSLKSTLRRLREAGRLAVVRVKKWWRRSLVLTWLAAAPEVKLSSPGGSGPRPPAEVPPAPPLCDGDKEDDGQERSSSVEAPPVEEDPATAELLAEARVVFGDDLEAERVGATVERHGAEPVRAALGWARKAAASSWGYVARALERGEAEGGIKPPTASRSGDPAKRPVPLPPAAAEVRAARAPEAPASDEDLETARRWATGESGPVLKRLGETVLRRRGEL